MPGGGNSLKRRLANDAYRQNVTRRGTVTKLQVRGRNVAWVRRLFGIVIAIFIHLIVDTRPVVVVTGMGSEL